MRTDQTPPHSESSEESKRSPRNTPKPKRPSPERLLRKAAKDGVILRPAALRAGVTRHQIATRLDWGFIDEVGDGVYVLAGCSLAGVTAQRAALAVARSRALGLWSALHGLGANRGVVPVRVQVLIPHERRVLTRDWFSAHRTRRLEKDEIVRRSGIPMSSGARSVRDLVASLPAKPWADAQITHAIEECLLVRATTIERLDQMSRRERAPQVRGRLDRLIERQRGQDPALFRSEGERWLRNLVIRLGLPMPEFNVRPPGTAGEVDALFPTPLIVEFDGFTTHRTRTKFDRDRRRDRVALRNGIPTLRITKTDYEDDRPQLEQDIAFLTLGSGKPRPL